VIDHQINGFLVEKQTNIDGYVHYIQLLLDNPDLSKDFANKLNQKVRELFTTENATLVWETILKQIK